MNYEEIKTEYLCYLMNRVGLEAEGEDGYLQLCKILQSVPFCPQLQMDENRCDECRELRNDFAANSYPEYCDILNGIYGGNGTMMELLLVLSEKMAYELSDSEYEASTRKWFKELLCNCGLDRYAENREFCNPGNGLRIREILSTVIFRRIEWSGDNGLFPLMYPQSDQRKAELIIQMNNYLEENYDIC